MLVECYVGVIDASFEVDLGGLEGVVGWKNEEEFEFAALSIISRFRTRQRGQSNGYTA